MIMSGQNGILTGQTSHVDWSHSLYLFFEQTANSLPVNLRFCLFVKIQSHPLTENHMRIRFSSLFFQSFDPSENENWRSKNFFGSAGHCVWPLPKNYFEHPCYWHKVPCKGNDIICSKKGRAVKIKEVVHCIFWRRIHSSYRLEQDCMEWPPLTAGFEINGNPLTNG